MTMYQELHRWEDAIEVAAARVSRVGGKTGEFSLFLTCRESLWAGKFVGGDIFIAGQFSFATELLTFLESFPLYGPCLITLSLSLSLSPNPLPESSRPGHSESHPLPAPPGQRAGGEGREDEGERGRPSRSHLSLHEGWTPGKSCKTHLPTPGLNFDELRRVLSNKQNPKSWHSCNQAMKI